ncbi:MAG TPA: hypothetical protein DDZ68_04950 [Parvularcula sp.]|jgi:hypothetical protein|nr:hypothetical protein [Parvularcula sp.]
MIELSGWRIYTLVSRQPARFRAQTSPFDCTKKAATTSPRGSRLAKIFARYYPIPSFSRSDDGRKTRRDMLRGVKHANATERHRSKAGDSEPHPESRFTQNRQARIGCDTEQRPPARTARMAAKVRRGALMINFFPCDHALCGTPWTIRVNRFSQVLFGAIIQAFPKNDK